MTEIRGKRIVITGATGFIGRNTAKRFLEQGAEVFVLVRQQSKQKDLLPVHENLHVVDGALEDIMRAADEIGSADAFLHFAWGGVNREEIDSPIVQKKNIDWSLECVNAAEKLGCKVFMDAGSRVEYGIKEDGVMEEHMSCEPVNEYGKAKLEFYRQAKPLCEKFHMTYYHLRFFSVYGAGDHPWSIISTLVRDLPQGKDRFLKCLYAPLEFYGYRRCVQSDRRTVPLQRSGGTGPFGDREHCQRRYQKTA